MSRFKTLAAVLVVTLGWSGMAGAGPMLTGTVTYDRSTQLYTYSYTLDDRTAPRAADLVEIRVATHVYDLDHLNSVSHTAPAPFTEFYTAEGGWDTPKFAGGTFYTWDAEWTEWNAAEWRMDPLTPGVYSGLSFTSRYGPGTGNAANYDLYGHTVNSSRAQVEIGRVVAPDLTNAPEPRTLALVVAGLMVAGLRRVRRSNQLTSPTRK